MSWFARTEEVAEARAQRVVPLRVAPVEVQVMGHESLDVLCARNVSETGLGVYVPHGFAGLDLAVDVDLVVTLPGVLPFLARGVIKHVTNGSGEPGHFGLHFTLIKKTDRASIERYVQSRTG